MPDRDAAIDRLLSRADRAGEISGATPECLDAETLAAWVDGSLPSSEAAAAERHASSCARCQTMLASLVRTLPSAPVAQPWWRRRWAMAGLVPLTAGAIALAIWVRTPEPRVNVAPAQEAASSAPQPAARSAPQAAAPSATQEAERPAPPAPSLADERRQRQAPPDSAGRDAAAAPPSFAPVPSSPPALSRADAPAGAKEAQKQADVASKDQEKKNEAMQKAGTAATDTLAAAAPRREGAGRIAGLSDAPARAQLRANAAEIAAPDGSVRWRIGAAGSIQRSADAGATWESLASGTTQDLAAGSAPASNVCWVVGRGGTVLLSTDGRTYRLVAFPERVDLVAVQAGDAVSASVTTADGRTFRTADGGRTWLAVQEI